MKKLLVLLCLTSTVYSYTFEVTLNDNKTITPDWKFSKDRQFYYFKSAQNIPSAFLPVELNTLSEKEGVWVLRHKDFLERPNIFTEGHESRPDKASISYSSHSIFFHSVKLNVFIFGEATLNLLTNARTTSHGHGARHLDKVSLGGKHYEYCVNGTVENNNSTTIAADNTTTESNDSGTTTMTPPTKVPKNDFRWVTYEVETSGMTQMEIEVSIHHQNSFIILDDIVVTYNPDLVVRSPTENGDDEVEEDGDGGDGTYKWSEEMYSTGRKWHEKEVPKPKVYRVHCSVEEKEGDRQDD